MFAVELFRRYIHCGQLSTIDLIPAKETNQYDCNAKALNVFSSSFLRESYTSVKSEAKDELSLRQETDLLEIEFLPMVLNATWVSDEL